LRRGQLVSVSRGEEHCRDEGAGERTKGGSEP
jgi:hypothetical protein